MKPAWRTEDPATPRPAERHFLRLGAARMHPWWISTASAVRKLACLMFRRLLGLGFRERKGVRVQGA